MARPSVKEMFSGSVPEIYHRYMVPLVFSTYAADIAARVAAHRPRCLLEVAAGTGAVTQELARALPGATQIVATDLNPAMLEMAQAAGIGRPIEWKVADAMRLPFEDGAFDAVVCQFGLMFLPDRAAGFAQMHRVLEPGGRLFFSVWDRLEENHFAHTVSDAVSALYPQHAERFAKRIPNSYFDLELIREDLVRGGFMEAPVAVTLSAVSKAASPQVVAVAYCQGTAIRAEIEAIDPGGVSAATAAAEARVAERFGRGAVEAKMQAHVITVRK